MRVERALFELLALASCCCLSACGAAPEPAARHYGAMRDVMRDGRTQGRVAVARHALPRWFGVGALAQLDGEILIDDGCAFVAVGSAENVFVAPADAQATLLTAAPVHAWRTIELRDTADLETIERTLANELPGNEHALIVPFVVIGAVEAIELHVVRGACPHAVDDSAHAPARWSPSGPASARVIGFFAPGQEGIVTHHGTSVHVHALVETERGRAMGHVDAVRWIAGARLLVPADG